MRFESATTKKHCGNRATLTGNHHDQHGHTVELVLEVVILRAQPQPGQEGGQRIGNERDDAERRRRLDVGCK